MNIIPLWQLVRIWGAALTYIYIFIFSSNFGIFWRGGLWLGPAGRLRKFELSSTCKYIFFVRNSNAMRALDIFNGIVRNSNVYFRYIFIFELKQTAVQYIAIKKSSIFVIYSYWSYGRIVATLFVDFQGFNFCHFPMIYPSKSRFLSYGI